MGQQGGSSRWEAWGPAGPTGPTGPGGPGGGGSGGGGGGASPPTGPLTPPPEYNPTLLVDSRLIELSPYCLCKHLGHLYAFVGLQIASDPGCLL